MEPEENKDWSLAIREGASLLGVPATQRRFTGPLNWEGLPGKPKAYS